MPSLCKQTTFDECNKAIRTSSKFAVLSCSLHLNKRDVLSFHMHSIPLSLIIFYHKWTTLVKRDEKRFISSFMNIRAGFTEPAGVSEDSPER